MRKTQHGFTVMELMTALTVLALLTAIATPTFRQFSANSRTSATANNLVSALAIARSEALHQSMPVAVCASADLQTCAGNATDWSGGWIVFTDGSGVKGQKDSTDVVVQAWPKPSGNVTVSLVAADTYIRFDQRGMKIPVSVATFTVAASGCAGKNASQIALTVTGSPQSTKVACP